MFRYPNQDMTVPLRWAARAAVSPVLGERELFEFGMAGEIIGEAEREAARAQAHRAAAALHFPERQVEELADAVDRRHRAAAAQHRVALDIEHDDVFEQRTAVAVDC